MTPALRRALHQCVDIICDALADEEAEKPKKRLRGPATPPPPRPTRPLTTEEQAQLDRQLAKAGYRKAG